MRFKRLDFDDVEAQIRAALPDGSKSGPRCVRVADTITPSGGYSRTASKIGGVFARLSEYRFATRVPIG